MIVSIVRLVVIRANDFEKKKNVREERRFCTYLIWGVTYRVKLYFFWGPANSHLVYDSWNFHYVINNYYCYYLWSYVSFLEIFLLTLLWAKFQRSAKVSVYSKQLVTYVVDACGKDKVSEFARQLRVAIYIARCHPADVLSYFFWLFL